MPVIKVGAFDLDYEDIGSGPPVVLVHSSASGYRQWHWLAASLQNRYRLIAVNLFGYGKTSSWPGSRPLTAADQAELVAAAVELAREPVALVGHSLGGAVAFEAAAKLSGSVRVLVAFEPILFNHLKTDPRAHMTRSRVWPATTMSWRRSATGARSANGSSTTGPVQVPGRPCPVNANRICSRCCRR